MFTLRFPLYRPLILCLAMLSPVCALNAQAQGQLQVNPAAVKVTVNGPWQTIEGLESTAFSVTLDPPNVKVQSYEWTWQADPACGNAPTVNFSTPAQATTTIRAARFPAFPNSQWSADTGSSGSYTINCNVKVDGQVYKDQSIGGAGFLWMVHVPIETPGTTWPRLVGLPEIKLRFVGANPEWYVGGLGTFSRQLPVIDPGTITPTGQFFNKVVTVHEGRHYTQYTTAIPGLIANTLYDRDGFYNNTLSTLTSTVSEGALRSLLQNSISTRNDADDALMSAGRPAREDDANTLSNAAAPPYLNNKIPYKPGP